MAVAAGASIGIVVVIGDDDDIGTVVLLFFFLLLVLRVRVVLRFLLLLNLHPFVFSFSPFIPRTFSGLFPEPCSLSRVEMNSGCASAL